MAESTTTQFLAGGGKMGERMRALDWSQTPLGPVEGWPQSLRSAISILLPSRAQICLFWGPDLATIYNDAYAPVLGLKHPWALGRPGREVWSELWDVLRPLFEGVLHTGEAFWAANHPFTMERKGFAEETFFDISYDPVRDESGAVGGLFCIVTETTGRVVGERRLALLRDLAARNATARTARDACALAMETLAGAPDVPFARVYLGDELQASTPGETATGEVRELAIPGGKVVVGLNPQRPFDEQYASFLDLVAGQVATAIDNGQAYEEERKRAEALAEIDRAKTAFFSNVSHEFRTPLTLMLGPLEDSLTDEANPLTPRQRERLELMRRNGVRLQRLVNTLLDFSRIEAGRAQASYAPTDLARFTAELASNFSTACEKAGLELRVDCPPLARPVYVDRGMWEKVVLNLLSNAFKFTFEGEIEVAIAATPRGAELRVRDTGIGVAAAELPRLFERFHRVEGARARTHEGSGIGLAFVRELVQLHGGEISVASEPGRGSVFTVALPFGCAHLPQERVVASTPAGSPIRGAAAFVEEALGWLGAHVDHEDETPIAWPMEASILVVDDNADMRDYVARLLRSRWHISTACDGLQALELIAQRDFDLVISDVMMPQLDGFGLLKAIKSRPETAALPVVLLSARAGEESRLDGMAAGADDYIIKPFTAQQLIAQVSAQLTVGKVRRKNAEERERQREQLYSLFTRAPSPIIILRGPDYVIDLANPAVCEVWGRPHADVIGRPLLQALPELEGQGFKELLDGVRASGDPYNGRETPAVLRNADGSKRTVYFNFVYTPLRAADGSIEAVLVTAFDVTDQVTAREQTSALRREAEAANRAKDEFLAMLGHELRNPLAPIATAIQLMRLRDAEVPELGILERQTAHLARLVDDLLDVSRITRGKIELRKRPVEIGDAVLRAMEMASPLLEQRAHRVSIEGVPGRGLAVNADPERLAQVVFNLLSNAAKYSEPSSTILVRGWRENERVRLSVRDPGAGIAPEMMHRVFDMFVQQHQTLERAQGGLGLGLTIVRSLVEMHGGRVTVSSAGLGQGSEFIIDLPAVPVVVPVVHAGQRQSARPRAGPAQRILVVDDNVDAVAVLSELLRALGNEVEVAHDGLRALAAAQRFKPELALIDIGLPVMDGYELARKLRDQYAALRLVAVTGYGLDRDRERSSLAGFSGHLVKPVDLAALEALLASPPVPVSRPDSGADRAAL